MAFSKRPKLQSLLRLGQRRLAFRLRLSLRLGHPADPARGDVPKTMDLMGFYGGLMGFNGILWWFNGI